MLVIAVVVVYVLFVHRTESIGYGGEPVRTDAMGSIQEYYRDGQWHQVVR